MPRITPERRLERRNRILDAARACFLREGLHSTSMDDIIAASGLSAGAVYGHFKGKDEIIVTALATSMQSLEDVLAPLLQQAPLPAPAALVAQVIAAIERFSAPEGFDLRRVAVLGWAEAQRNPAMAGVLAASQQRYLGALQSVAAAWRDAGIIAPDADPGAVAATMLSLIMGHVAQSAILGPGAPNPAEGLAMLGRPA